VLVVEFVEFVEFVRAGNVGPRHVGLGGNVGPGGKRHDTRGAEHRVLHR
jgi:hypothetical protein